MLLRCPEFIFLVFRVSDIDDGLLEISVGRRRVHSGIKVTPTRVLILHVDDTTKGSSRTIMHSPFWYKFGREGATAEVLNSRHSVAAETF